MAITIKEQNGIFNLYGVISADTSKSFQTHFEQLLNSANELTINIEGIKEIDASGVMVLKKLHYHALSMNKVFAVIGYGCKDFYDELSHNNAA